MPELGGVSLPQEDLSIYYLQPLLGEKKSFETDGAYEVPTFLPGRLTWGAQPGGCPADAGCVTEGKGCANLKLFVGKQVSLVLSSLTDMFAKTHLTTSIS